MSFKSQAHKEKIKELVKAGKISQSEFERLERATKDKKIPERIHPKKK